MSGARAATVQELDRVTVARLLPVRASDAHKQTHGRLLVIAGSLDYLGAGLLTTLAAVRAGAGLVCLCVPASLQSLVAGRVPEAITAGLSERAPYEVDAGKAFVDLVGQDANALVIGPGLAAGPGTRDLITLLVQEAALPTVLDAEALNVLAATDRWWERSRVDAVLTPHPGEFARLDGGPVGGSDDERASRAAAAAARWRHVVVLKGARTVIASPTGELSRAPFAEPVLATAGTGDVLAGIIGALLAQGMAPFDAARTGVWLHGIAAVEWRSRHGDAGLAASDLPPLIPGVRRDLIGPRAGDAVGPGEASVVTPAVPTSGPAAAVLDLGRLAWLEVDQAGLSANLAQVRSLVGPAVRIAAVVKADAYGHGLLPAARIFVAAGADRLCVATLEEALTLRASLPDVPILVLFAIPAREVETAARASLELVASDESMTTETLAAWARTRRPGMVVRFHLEVETGLGRGGVAPEGVVPLLRKLVDQPQVEVSGLWSHLARADDEPTSTEQGRLLEDAATRVAEAGMVVPPLHMAGTGGLFAASCAHHDMVRPGLALYGELPDGLAIAPTAMAVASALRPALTLKARPVRVISVPRGTQVGYGGRWVAERASRIATLPLGYGDGFARGSQPGGSALVRGTRVPLVGTVAMDAVAADVTDLPTVGMDDEFVLLGVQGTERITATELAQRRNTISWEVLSSMAQRLPRVYHAGPRVISVRTMAGESFVGPEHQR